MSLPRNGKYIFCLAVHSSLPSPEELLVLSVEEKLAQLDAEFRDSSDYVLKKNAELYGRLA